METESRENFSSLSGGFRPKFKNGTPTENNSQKISAVICSRSVMLWVGGMLRRRPMTARTPIYFSKSCRRKALRELVP